MVDIPTIEPFQFIRSTAFSERVQLANKLNEVIDALNQIGSIDDLQTQIDTINSEISEIQTAIEDTNSDVSTLSNQLNTIVSEVNGLLKEVVNEVILDAPEYGQVRVRVIHEDETETASNTLQMPVIVDGGISLISGTTARSFKIRYITADGVTHTTNDFVIPEGGGGTDVTVTSVTILEGDTDNSFKFEIGLSDGSEIQSNSYPFPAASELTPATTSQLGGIKVGTHLSVTADGTLSVDMTEINTAAVASTVMFTADASKVTMHADSLAGSEFTEDIPQASQGGAGTIDAAAYQKLQNMPAPDTIATNADVTNLQEQLAQMNLSKASPNQATLNGGSIQLVESVTLNIEGTTLKTNVNGIEGEVTIPGSELSFNGTHHTFSRCVNEIYDNYSYAERGLIIFSFIQPNYNVKFAASGFYNSSRRIVGYAVGTVNDEPINFIRVNKESESSYSMEFILYDENWSNPTTKLTLDQTHGSIECSFIQIAP